MSRRLSKKFYTKLPLNYLYFSALLLFLILLNINHFLNLETPLSLLFLTYAVGQALFEVGGFILILAFLQQWAPRWTQQLFISLSFLLCLVHFTDFTMLRLMDAPISYLFKFLFYSGVICVLQSLNLNTSMIAITTASLLLIPILGPLFYWLTNLGSRKKKMSVSIFQIGVVLGSIGALLLGVDLVSHPFLDRPNYAKLQKTLPFKGTLLHPGPQCVELPRNLTPCRQEKTELPVLSANQLPNIYFFIIETLRRDYVTAETAPCMTAFGKENISFARSFANSNSTQLSWFAIFHSNFPYHWTKTRDSWKRGSVPLQLMRRLGYRIKVFASADLHYFDMDRLIFGENRQLADKIVEFLPSPSLKSCERDALAIDHLEQELLKPEGRYANAYFIFLDATHSEYSFPDDFPIKFQPIVSQIDYLTLTEKKIEPLKNRYKNAIAYVDTLIERVLIRLKDEGLYKTAIIAITGDHGEEFFEEKALFHGTHLNHIQTSVPIFCRFPSPPGRLQTQEATHMDLLPSILHVLTKQSDFSSLFDGQSVFSPNRWPYRIAVLQNGPETPYEFLIAAFEKEFRVRFLSARDIYQQKRLELIQVKTAHPLPEGLSLQSILDTQFPNALTPLLETGLEKEQLQDN